MAHARSTIQAELLSRLGSTGVAQITDDPTYILNFDTSSADTIDVPSLTLLFRTETSEEEDIGANGHLDASLKRTATYWVVVVHSSETNVETLCASVEGYFAAEPASDEWRFLDLVSTRGDIDELIQRAAMGGKDFYHRVLEYAVEYVTPRNAPGAHVP